MTLVTTSMRMTGCHSGSVPTINVAVDVDLRQVGRALRLLGGDPRAEAHVAPLAAALHLVRHMPAGIPKAMEELISLALLAALPRPADASEHAVDNLVFEAGHFAHHAVRDLWKRLDLEPDWD